MKFMKIGTRPDTFYTEEATRTVISDIPSDLCIKINNITYLLHKFVLLPKCGLLQRLCSDSGELENFRIELQDIPGGEEAFELCAKFCYGITIKLSADNFVPAICAAKFLHMIESFEKGNFLLKLEFFFNSCILDGWKDSIATLQSTVKLSDWSEGLGIVKKCLDSIVEKILTPTSKVMWSYTYTRPGYNKKHHSVPKDWWTEDISDLDIDLFRYVITAIRSTYQLPPQLIGEALHVYACRWLPDTTKAIPPENSDSPNGELVEKNCRILETIVNMIPLERGSVSVGFLLRLCSIASYIGASAMTKTELLRNSSLQLEEAIVDDLLFPSQSPSVNHFYDIDLVTAVVESYLEICRRQSYAAIESSQFLRSIRNIGKLIDTYLQIVARDVNMPVSKIASLAEALPDIAREDHDDIYKAINIYLKEHPDLTKAEKKRLCRVLDCQKLSPELRGHAVKNERLPLRTVVQVLFFKNERGSKAFSHDPPSLEQNPRSKFTTTLKDELSKPKLDSENREKNHRKMKISNGKLPLKLEKKGIKAEIEEVETKKGRERVEEGISGSKLETKKITHQRNGSEQGCDKVRDR